MEPCPRSCDCQCHAVLCACHDAALLQARVERTRADLARVEQHERKGAAA